VHSCGGTPEARLPLPGPGDGWLAPVWTDPLFSPTPSTETEEEKELECGFAFQVG